MTPAIRSAILANPAITAQLSTWNGEPAVFTRVPVPTDAEGVMIVCPEPFGVTDNDFLNSSLTNIARDIIVYGEKGAPGSPDDDTRTIEAIGWELRDMFHRKHRVLGNTPFHVVSITVAGPRVAPTDDESHVARMVTLNMRIQ